MENILKWLALGIGVFAIAAMALIAVAISYGTPEILIDAGSDIISNAFVAISIIVPIGLAISKIGATDAMAHKADECRTGSIDLTGMVIVNTYGSGVLVEKDGQSITINVGCDPKNIPVGNQTSSVAHAVLDGEGDDREEADSPDPDQEHP